MLDQVLRPYFTAPKSFYSDCGICHPPVYEEDILAPAPIEKISSEADAAPQSEKIQKKEDPLWWVAFTVTVGAAGCVIAA